MPTFLWSGKTTSGREEADEIEAVTALEARKILEARGWTDLRQHTSEINDFLRRRRVAESPAAEDRVRWTPKERVQYFDGKMPGLWGNWLKNILQSAAAILALTVFLFFAITNSSGAGKDIMIGVFGFLLVFGVCLYPALRWWSRRGKRLFVKLHTARTWYRWNEVLSCLDKITTLKRATSVGIDEFAMARYRALALTGLGRLDEAMAGYRLAAEKAKAPQWLSFSFQAEMHIIAKQYDKALGCYRLALDEAVDKSTISIDLGIFLVKRFNRPEEAGRLLAQVEKAQLSELARIYVPYLRGIIAFRQKDFVNMDKNIRETLGGLEKRGKSKAYIFEGSVLTCQGYLAVSSAALGRKGEAQRYFRQSEKYLKLIGLDDLVAQYQALTGGFKNSTVI